jgi:methionyl-tRNA formyltransferase
MNHVRVAFFGSPPLARACLEELHHRFDVRLVVTQPDREKGRGRKISMTPVKSYAVDRGIAVYQSGDLGEPLIDELSKYGTDLIVVVAFGRILPGRVIDAVPRGSLNLHASLLPKYRGPSPIEAALLAGERETGITLQLMAPEMDRGDILSSLAISIGNDWTAEDLYAVITERAPSFLVQSVHDYLDGKLSPVPQDESRASYCSVVKKENGTINWHEEAERIRNKIRAYNLWPVAQTTFQGKQLKIFNARTAAAPTSTAASGKPGEVVSADMKEGIIVQTGSGRLIITDLQIENRRRMNFKEFLNGHRNIRGSVLGSS